jgi:DNA-directed RNA polymerase specialized sigma24 family protein
MGRDIEGRLRVVLAEIDACRMALVRGHVPARDVADLMQQARIEAWRGVERDQIDTSRRSGIRAWLWRVGQRLAAQYHNVRRGLRARGVPVVHTDIEAARGAHASPSPEDLALARTPVVELHAALAELAQASPERYAVVLGYAFEGGSMAEVAAALSIPENTSWNRWRLAVLDLRARLRRRR